MWVGHRVLGRDLMATAWCGLSGSEEFLRLVEYLGLEEVTDLVGPRQRLLWGVAGICVVTAAVICMENLYGEAQ